MPLPTHRLASLLIVILSPAIVAADEPARIAPSVKTFMDKYCSECHGAEHESPALRFDMLPYEIGDQGIAQRWQDILDTLNLDQMPPEEAPQPSKEELSNALETLTADLREARKRLTDSGGQVVLRRLNRREYRNTIDALFGVPVDTDKLPEDGIVDGFDTLGQAHNFSSLHLERYLELGRQVLDQVIVTKGRKQKPIQRRSEPETLSKKIREELPRLEGKLTNYAKQVADGRKGLEIRQEITQEEIRLSRQYLSRQDTKSGVLVPFKGLMPSTWISIGNNAPTGIYQVRVHCGAVAETVPDDLYLKVVRGEYRSKVPDAIEYYRVTNTQSEPQTIEFTVKIDGIQSDRLTFERRDHLQQLHRFENTKSYFFKYQQVANLLEDDRPNLWIDWIDVEGPLPRPAPPLCADRILAGYKLQALSTTDVRNIIKRFAFEAFRHQDPSADYVDHLLSIYSASRAQGFEQGDALKDALTVVLASPRFLFLYEPRTEPSKRPLDDRELAVRLAYFLWSAPPDDDLYRVAAAGKLRDPATLAEEVERMIRSERSATFVENFTEQWLELSRLDLVAPAAVDQDYDHAIQQSSRREVIAFVNRLLQDDLAVTNLLDSEFAVVNSLMAQFYGLTIGVEDEFSKVALPTNSPRGGLLGQSAILTLTGTGDRTSPVERGAFVLRKLLNRPPPPAPANVPMLDEETVGERSIRETLAVHMTKAQCRSCHRRIDPLGFGMENFDPVGRWRTQIRSTDGSQIFSVKPAGVMPDGKRTFADFEGLKAHLSAERDSLLSGLTEAIMTYSVGRTIGFSDRDAVEQVVQETAASGYGLKTLIHNVVKSDAFQTK